MTHNRCGRCHRRYRGAGDWNADVRAGVVVALICPACQTTAENTEAVVHEATLTYGQDDYGRLIGRIRQ